MTRSQETADLRFERQEEKVAEILSHLEAIASYKPAQIMATIGLAMDEAVSFDIYRDGASKPLAHEIEDELVAIEDGFTCLDVIRKALDKGRFEVRS